MIIYQYYDWSDFFIIFINNSKWNDIISNISIDFNIIDYSDIISWIFNLKLKILINNLLNKYIFEKMIIDISIIEFQKWDLSYIYILLIMNHNNKIRDIKDIDNIICIEIFDCNIDSNLYDIVINNMIHDSYDSIYSNLSYIKNEKYSKKYSWQFCDEIILNEEDYSIYWW